MDSETWLPVVGYENTHMVSDLGRVKSLAKSWTSGRYKSVRHTDDKILAEIKTRHGYSTVNIHKDGVRMVLKVHRLVAFAFIPNPNGKREVNHKNGIKSDNSVVNLEWATRSENNKHAYDIGLNPKYKKIGLDKCPHCSKVIKKNFIKKHILFHHKQNQ